MTSFNLPRDSNSAPVQALSPVTNVTNAVSSAAQVRFAIPAATQIIRIATASNCYIKFGDNAVVATTSDILFPAGTEVFNIKEYPHTHISVLGVDAAASPASITQMV